MIRRSLVMAFADKSAGVVLTTLTMIVVSRLLTPAEVGHYMVASAIVIMTEAFRDFGAAACIIRERDLSEKLVRTAFTVMAMLSAVLGGLLYLSAGPISVFYGSGDLRAIIHIVTISFALAPISNPLLALLRRDMRFGAVARISILAATAQAATCMGLAWYGFAAESLAWGSVMSALVTTLGVVIVRPAGWVFRPTLAEWRKVVPFGAWASVITILTMLYDSLPRLILGRAVGFNAVGLFTRAVSLTQLPERLVLSAVQPVVLPAFSGMVRDRTSLHAPYLAGLAYITALQWPALVGLAILAEPVVHLLLGPQWLAAVPLVRVVALAGLFLTPGYLAFPLLIAAHRERDMALASLITLPPAFVVMLVAAQFGLMPVALSLFLTGPFTMIVLLRFVRPLVGFTWSELARLAGRGLLVTVASAVGPLAVALLSEPVFAPGWTGTGLALLLSAAGWLAGLMAIEHPLAPEIRRAAASLLRSLRARQSRAA